MSTDTGHIDQLRAQVLHQKTRADLYEEVANEMCQRWLDEKTLADRLVDALTPRLQSDEVVYAITVHTQRRAEERQRAGGA